MLGTTRKSDCLRGQEHEHEWSRAGAIVGSLEHALVVTGALGKLVLAIGSRCNFLANPERTLFQEVMTLNLREGLNKLSKHTYWAVLCCFDSRRVDGGQRVDRSPRPQSLPRLCRRRPHVTHPPPSSFPQLPHIALKNLLPHPSLGSCHLSGALSRTQQNTSVASTILPGKSTQPS